jgi:hypothetical protein
MGINRNAILKARDLLGISYKFKPWGAVKLAEWMKGTSIALNIIGDVGGTILEIVEYNEFKKKNKKFWIGLKMYLKKFLRK